MAVPEGGASEAGEPVVVAAAAAGAEDVGRDVGVSDGGKQAVGPRPGASISPYSQQAPEVCTTSVQEINKCTSLHRLPCLQMVTGQHASWA